MLCILLAFDLIAKFSSWIFLSLLAAFSSKWILEPTSFRTINSVQANQCSIPAVSNSVTNGILSGGYRNLWSSEQKIRVGTSQLDSLFEANIAHRPVDQRSRHML
jgi:hypothetical protein